MSKKIKPGTVLKIPKKLQLDMNERLEQINAIDAMVVSLSSQKLKLQKALWRYVGELFPDTRKYYCVIAQNTGELLVKYEMNASEKRQRETEMDIFKLLERARERGEI